MTYFNANNGYHGFSMSNRAFEAYEDGKKPISKWTKSEILESASEFENANISIDLLKKLRVSELKDLLLVCTEWHHTGNYFKSTNFYKFNEENFENLTDADIQKIISKREQKSKKEESKKEIWKCEYLEWSGTRSHPHAKKVQAVGEIRGNWFYLENGKKKNVNARGFKQIEEIK